MILREPTFDDCAFIADCYRDWPRSIRGRVFPVDVRNWINRYRTQPEEIGLVGVEAVPVGFVLYGTFLVTAAIHDIVVHPDLRGAGHAKAMWKTLQRKLAQEGVVAAEFDALPGPIADKVSRGDFEKVSEGVGAHTGLPTIRGRVRADTAL